MGTGDSGARGEAEVAEVIRLGSGGPRITGGDLRSNEMRGRETRANQG